MFSVRLHSHTYMHLLMYRCTVAVPCALFFTSFVCHLRCTLPCTCMYTHSGVQYIFPHTYTVHIHSHIHSHTHTHSLGISMLEVSCDLELPSGGQNWHLLRQGRMPEDFTKGSGCPPGLLMGQWFDRLENHIDQKIARIFWRLLEQYMYL